MRLKLLLCFSLILNVLNTQSQQFNWATSVTGTNYEYGIKSIIDDTGNTYFVGYSSGSPIIYNGVSYPANGRGDAFFAKLDSNKNLVWMKSVGGNDSSYYDSATDIHMDAFGDIYLLFNSAGSNFKYNGQILSGINSPGQYSGEGVMIKVNANGDYLWHDSGAVSTGFQKVTTDTAGNVFLIGSFYSTVTLGNSITLTNPSTGTTTDLFVAKYQPNGTIIWAKRAGGLPHNTFAYGHDVKINPQTNEIIVLGKGDGAVYFDGIPMPLYNGSNKGLVLISYTSNGVLNWVKRVLDFPGSTISSGTSLDISSSGIMAVAAYNNATRAMVGFYTNSGSVISQQIYSSTGQIKVNSIVFNEFNDTYITGTCTTNGVIGISPGTVSITGTSGFIAKMDIFQQVKWVQQFVATSFSNQLFYKNGKIQYAGRIDANFTYNSGQNVIPNTAGDALFGQIIDYQLPLYSCNITGTVFQDLNADCTLNTNDIVQKYVIVKAVDTNGTAYYAVSDSNGHYDIPVTTGSYTVQILTNPAQSSLIHQSCYTQQNVSLTIVGQDADNVNFPVELSNCPLLSVDVSSDRRRRCFEGNTYVSYSNSGFADAQNVEVIVKLPEYVSFVSSNYPYTINSQGNFVFAIGVLAPNQSGFIHIVDHVQCINGITGLTQCTKAWITPKNVCANTLDPDYNNWDKSSVRVEGTCVENSQVQFTLLNTGEPGMGDMQNPHEYRIYVDNALAQTGTFQLNGGQSTTVNYPSNGETIRLEADQSPYYPGDTIAQDTVEGCSFDLATVSRGFVNTMRLGDDDIDYEMDCLPIIDSYDPNDKMVSPSGITSNHYVKAGTVLDYKIRFQNTGTDTAYKVVIKDALAPYLDPSTIQWGVSSHPYTIKITGTGTPVLEFTFDNINLPHSAVNEPGSNGFVKFKVATYSSLANGVVVNNNANIYFDYNLPIETNTAQITISDFVPTYVPLAVNPFLSENIKLYPNPTSGRVVIESDTLQKVEIYSLTGILMETTTDNQIDLSGYAKGIYLVKITTDKGIALKKIIFK